MTTDQQPHAEAVPFGYVSQHTNGSWEFSPTAAGVYPDTAKSITAVYTKQPQAEAVPQCVGDVVRALTRYDWRRSNIWRYYYASATGTYVKVEDFVASLNQIVAEIDAQKGAQ